MYDESLLMHLVCLLLPVYAALLWLKPGKYEAARYAMILLPAGGLFYLLSVYTEMGMLRYCIHHHVFVSGALLVLLLGRYMLKCDWKQALYAAGVYELCVALVRMVVLPLFLQRYMVSWTLSLCSCAAILNVWLFVWLCARKSGISRKEGFLSAAAIVACSSLIFGNLAQFTALLLHSDSVMEGMELMMISHAALRVVSDMLCFTLVMCLIHRQSWLRSVAYALLVQLAYSLAGAVLGVLAWLVR